MRVTYGITAVIGALIVVSACQKNSQANPVPEKVASQVKEAQSTSEDLNTNTVVARWTEGGKEKTLTYGELKDERLAAFRKIEQERYNAIRRELESYVLDKLLTAAAAKEGKSSDEYIASLSAAIPADKVKSFYEQNVARGGKGPKFEVVEDRIRQYLSMQDTVTGLKSGAKLKVTLPEPKVPLAQFDLSDRPRKGPKGAKLTIVEFSDFQCPYCARATAPVEEIIKAFPKDVQVYFLHFPLSFHKEAMPAAIAARCAQKQGKFWEMHDLIFENQKKLAAADLKAHAKGIGLDVTKYDACVADPKTAEFVNNDIKQGTSAGVGGTPSFYINGKPTRGGPPTVDQIRELLEG